MANFKVIVKKHSDGYVAYSLGLKGVVIGEGDTYEGVLAYARSAIMSISRPSEMRCSKLSLRSSRRSSLRPVSPSDVEFFLY